MAICSGITYDATDNRITVNFVSGDVKGDSFADAYNINDIIDTDQDNGWGVFSKYGNVYISNASIWIQGTDTYFKDGQFVLIFQGSFSDTNLFNVQNGSNVIIDDELAYYQKGLNSLLINDTGSSGYAVSLHGSNIQEYRKITFTGWGGIELYEGIYYYLSVYHCSLIRLRTNVTLDSLYSMSNNTGISLYATPGSLSVKNVYIPVSNRSIEFVSSNTIKNIQSLQTTSGVYFSARAGIFNIIDSNVDIDKYSYNDYYDGSSTMQLKSTLSVNISGGDGGTAILYDQFGDQVIQNTLSGEWNPDPILYAKRYIESENRQIITNEKTVYEPFKLVVEKDGYDTLTIPNITVTAGEETIVFGKIKKKNYVDRQIKGKVEKQKIEGKVEKQKIEGKVTIQHIKGKITEI